MAHSTLVFNSRFAYKDLLWHQSNHLHVPEKGQLLPAAEAAARSITERQAGTSRTTPLCRIGWIGMDAVASAKGAWLGA